jgi:hypothetical protein
MTDDKVKRLVEAAKAVHKLIEDEELVRNIKHDDEPGWAIRAMPVVHTLAQFQVALAAVEREQQADVQPPTHCGHPASEIVSSDEGTSYCRKCAAEQDAPKGDWLCSQPGCGLWHSEHNSAAEQASATVAENQRMLNEVRERLYKMTGAHFSWDTDFEFKSLLDHYGELCVEQRIAALEAELNKRNYAQEVLDLAACADNEPCGRSLEQRLARDVRRLTAELTALRLADTFANGYAKAIEDAVKVADSQHPVVSTIGPLYGVGFNEAAMCITRLICALKPPAATTAPEGGSDDV